MLVYLNDAVMSACESFALSYWEKERLNSSPFGDDNFEKRRLNILSGKMGEYAAQAVLGDGISDPDMTMWRRGFFQTEPDLTGHGLRFHVKTKLSFIGGFTWIAHKDDPAVANPQANDIFILTVADVDTRCVDVRWIVPGELIKPKWCPPESPTMAARGKVAIWESGLTRWPKFDPFALFEVPDD